jgi:hypothetical protein
MSYTDRQKSFIDSQSGQILISLGITREDLRNSLDLREQYNKLLANSIASNPGIFSQDQVSFAEEVITNPMRTLESMTPADLAIVFFTEATKQAENINPFSAFNINKTYLIAGVLIVTIGAVVAYKVTPKIPMK